MNPTILDTLRSNLSGSTERAQLIGTGMRLRFMETGASVETLVSLGGDPVMTDAVAWWHDLDTDRRTYLTTYAQMAATHVRLQAEDLADMGPGVAMPALLQNLFQQRDELASMRATLHLVGALGDLDDFLATADEVLMGLMPVADVPADPYLAAVARRSMSAWWAEPFRG